MVMVAVLLCHRRVGGLVTVVVCICRWMFVVEVDCRRYIQEIWTFLCSCKVRVCILFALIDGWGELSCREGAKFDLWLLVGTLQIFWTNETTPVFLDLIKPGEIKQYYVYFVHVLYRTNKQTNSLFNIFLRFYFYATLRLPDNNNFTRNYF